VIAEAAKSDHPDAIEAALERASDAIASVDCRALRPQRPKLSYVEVATQPSKLTRAIHGSLATEGLQHFSAEL